METLIEFFLPISIWFQGTSDWLVNYLPGDYFPGEYRVLYPNHAGVILVHKHHARHKDRGYALSRWWHK